MNTVQYTGVELVQQPSFLSHANRYICNPLHSKAIETILVYIFGVSQYRNPLHYDCRKTYCNDLQ